ncbi:NADH-quinone oxidoreductase subunit L [Helicobacter sp.]|uniref:NADH-quinone oxidoreductase subunit L n=1 Tax=Helicobacter sp. TaxID=218 RepID=UPI0025C562F1|nr:NADH-quinone oxidoreductase subunit L [Helicobacter sp.]MCI5968005.1 NADH-quinone oxidoreductase subunit L [Helicobacter sp.]MDY2584656.1 NADH-quinone oxidoreductase subunit L [Helicobacter sp.]
MEVVLYSALFAPLVGSIFGIPFASKKKFVGVGIFASLMLAVSFFASLLLFIYAFQGGGALKVTLMDWIGAGGLYIPFGFLVDSVSATMMLVVTLVSLCVHIYAIGYMSHDASFNRFFVYLSAFVFSMLILVMSDNFAGLFIGWEGVGLCSWMLIGFWYERDSASFAANEAFIMNRIADLGMLLGIFLIYWTFGSLNYEEVLSNIYQAPKGILIAIGVLLFVGAMGKSAQFPLHTWLADAMEGPTPVSALIHAATMVTAGVYLVIRANPLYSIIPEVGFAIACLGAFVAVFAATMALVNRDLKRIIAYSTLSQLGYMFVAAGLEAYWIALFHLATHAFFKSLLFLGAGNVMHAMHDKLDISKMGALYQPLKFTAILMVLASIALAGIYPFSGFFSKDKILEAAFGSGAYVLWGALLLGAFLTAFYSFRLIMLVFFGEKKHAEHPHEAYPYMLYAMLPLGVLAIFAGMFEGYFHHFILQTLPDFDANLDSKTIWTLIIITSFVALGGIAFAIFKYRSGGFSPKWENTFIYKALSNQYFIPALYDKLFIQNYFRVSKIAWFSDKNIIDFVVDLIARLLKSGGENMRWIQGGSLSKMLKIMFFGVVALLLLVFIYREGVWTTF